jgi:hypothetical protein
LFLQPDILDNPVFMTALESVISGVLPVRCAAEKFGIRETSLVAAVMWTSIEPQSSGDGDSESSAFDRILQVTVCLLHTLYRLITGNRLLDTHS